jgi:vancomycin resistance protein YoaR
MSAITYPQKNTLSTLEQVLLAILIGLILSTLVLVAFGLGVQFWFAGRIFPGVTIAGVDLSGLKPQEASILLQEQIKYPQEGRILLRRGEQTWLLQPLQLGLFLDPETTASQAMSIGRQGNLVERIEAQWRVWRYGKTLAPVMIFDKRIANAQLNQLASQINEPVIEAQLSLEGTQVVVHSGKIGQTVNVDATIERLAALLPGMHDGMVDLVIEQTPPYIIDPTEQAELAKTILSENLVLKADNAEGSPWEIDIEALASMLRIERVQDDIGSRFQIGLNTDLLREMLNSLAPGLKTAKQNARYIFNDDTGQLEVIQNAVIGRDLDIENSIQDIQKKIIEDGTHEVSLVFIEDKPILNNEVTGAELGVTELIHSESSYFYGSSRDRVHNIAVAAEKFHGLMIPPGETFSMAEALGDISLENGYAEALIIAGGQTITGVGGGVCQVSTTLFRAAFFAGFPIVERYSHAYRVSYYEKVAGGARNVNFAGLDATVYVPVVDFKFKNDTPNWVLMETYVNPTYSSIQWKFYSTSDGRTVDWTTTGPTNIVEAPEPKYKENPDLDEGEIKQVDWAADGADVNVTRSVIRNGEVLFEDRFFTHYRPWQAVYEYGPGTEIPTPEP